MLAAVYHGAKDLRVEEVSMPKIGAGDLLLRVNDASICGTDLRIYQGSHRKYPEGTVRVPGHEVVGTIEELGSGVQGFSLGQRVFVAPNMGCGHCRQCISGNNNLCADYEAIGISMNGGFAQFLRVPEKAILQGNVIPLREGVDSAEGALIEPFACVLRGQNALGIQPGESVLIIGAGPIGVTHIKMAHLHGAGRVIVSELTPERQAQAAHLGADRVVNPSAEDLAQVVAEETQGRGVDVVIVAAPAPAAQESALQLAAISGRINFFGGLPQGRSAIQFDSNIVHYKELRVTATSACSTANCMQAAEIVNSGQVHLRDLVSQRFPLAQAVAAFAAAQDYKSLKVVLEP